MLDWLKRITAPPVFEGDEDKTRVAAQLNVILWGYVGVIVLVGIAVPFVFLSQALEIMVVIGVTVLLLLGMLFLMRRGQVRLCGGLFSSGMWLLYGGLLVAAGGMTTPFVLLWIVIVVMAGLLLGWRAAIVFAGLSVVAGLGILVAELQGVLPPPMITISPIGGWAMLVAFLSIVAILLYLMLRGIDEALGNVRRYAAELEEQRGQLEDLVAGRTRDLLRRSNYLEATTAVAREAASMLNRRQLLTQVTRLISERFDCYHTGLFLLDGTRQWAVLQAASSEGGQSMLARGHRLQVGSQGLVGHVAAQGTARIALDVGQDAIFFDNPDLPDTRSEIAMPLRVRGEIIGVLDMQSKQANAFSPEDVAVLETLSDQVALAINNAQLFEQAQAAIEAERRAAGEITGQAWQNLIRSQTKTLAYIRRQDGLTVADATFQPPAPPSTGRPAPVQDEPTRLIVPIKVRDQVIGVMDANQPDGEWTPERVALVETLTEQLGVALESARLYQDTQQRATQERLVGEVTTRMRATLDIDTILQTAVREIAQALDAQQAELRLGAGPLSSKTSRSAGQSEALSAPATKGEGA